MTDRPRGLKGVASAGLAALCIAFASCSGPVAPAGKAAGNAPDPVEVTVPTTVTQPQGGGDDPDLTVPSASASDSAPAAGAAFTLSAAVRNSGGGVAEATTLRYYRSADATITTADIEVGTEAITALAGAGSAGKSVDLTAPATPGTYYYGACVDAVTDETDVTNNCSPSVPVTVTVPQLPELLVTSASMSDDGPVIGATLTLSATVRNAGGGASEATELRYYRSTDATIAPTDTHLGTELIGELAGEGSASKSLDLTAPATPGTYYYGACVQAVTGESDTTNNCSPSVPVTARSQARESQGDPDLVVPSASVSDSGPAAGATFTLSATARNDGDGAAAATTLRFYRSADATITTADSSAGTASIAGLAASGSAGGSVDLTAPATPGTYYYGACVDAVTGESDTTNNCSSSVTVTVPSPKHPDLAVTSPSVSDSSPATGGSVTLSATVSNSGNGAAAATTLRFYRSADATITTADTQVGTSAITGLAASGSVGGSVDLTAPATAGTYYYGACVDSVTDESDTTNNCSSAVQVDVQEAVQEPKPDLLMSNLRVDLTDPVTGETFTLSADVLNGTRAAAATTTLRYYRSADSTITTSDTEVGTDAVDALSAYGSSAESISLTAPATTGAYYYGACVDAVAGESDTTNNCSYSVKVDVVAQQRRVDISPRTLTFEAVGDSETVTVRILDENGDEDTEASFTWFSSYPVGPVRGPCCALEKVDGGLAVTMTKAGTMRVDLFSDDAKTARLQVTAYQKAASLEVSPSSVTLEVDGTDTLSATVKDANGHAIEGRTVYWTTSDSDVATVQGADDGGETGATATLTAAATGTATITARHAVKFRGTAAVTVTSK